MEYDNDDDGLLSEAWVQYITSTLISGFEAHLCEHTVNRRFIALFGCSMHITAMIWALLDVVNLGPDGAKLHHLLWALMFMKTYGTCSELACIFEVDEKTFRKWIWLIIIAISKIEDIVSRKCIIVLLLLCYLTDLYFQKIEWENRFMMADAYQRCLVVIDGTDFKINEPFPFDPSYFSHKFNHAALRYKIGVCIKTGWIVWVLGPFAAGAWPDLRISREVLHYELCDQEMYVADGGYKDGNGWSVNPDGTHTFAQRQFATARARTETINGCFKKFRCLKEVWRHEIEKHGAVMTSVAIIVQLSLREGKLSWMVDYDEADMEDF